jgi:hypothetical protein
MRGEPGKPGEAETPSRAERNRLVLRVGIVALALLVGVIAWVATRDGDEEATQGSTAAADARIVSVEELEDFAASAGHPVYWAGPMAGKELELSEGAGGNVQVRYLEAGTEAGGGGLEVLTIGSYPLPDAEAALEGFAKRKDSLVRRSGDGREIVIGAQKPTSVYFADPDGGIQVEVYDPSYERAIGLALSDRVRPVG